MFGLVALLALPLAAFAARVPLRHEARQAPPSGFVKTGAAPADQSITFSVALTSADISGLESKLLSISTPGSSDFRQWLTADEVKAFVQPSADTVAAFAAFAKAHDLETSVISPNGDWVSFTTTVAHANELLGADFQTFTHASLSTR